MQEAGGSSGVTLYTDLTNYLQDKPDFLHFAFWGTVAMTFCILLALIFLCIFRINFIYTRFRRRLVEQAWTDAFRYLRAGEEPDSYPILSRADKSVFLEFWLENRELASPEFANLLDELARRVALHNTIIAILNPGKIEFLPSKVWLQGIAIAAIEYVDNENTRGSLLEMTKSENIYLVVQACTVLAKLRVKGFEKEIIQTMFRFPKDAPEIFSRVSQAGGSDVLHVMQPFLERLPHHTVMNFISLAEQSHDETLVPILLHRLRVAWINEEIAALIRALSRLNSPGLREAILPFLDYPDLYVRIQTAKAIGRLGTADDIQFLKPLLSDGEWWLRYRAARAICKLCELDWETLEELRASLSDKFARDIIMHAYEEMEWCST